MRNVRKNYIDRKIIMMISFLCRIKRNRNEVFALDAIFITVVYELKNNKSYFKIFDRDNLSIKDAIKIKELTGMTNSEAIDIFLS